MKKNKQGLLTIIVLVFLLLGCQSQPQESATQQNEIEVTDSQGTVKVVAAPEKIVVFDLGALDTLNKLGQADKVVGIPGENLPTYLNAFADLPSVGGLKEPDLEKTNQLKPDLIIISGRQADSYEALKQIAPTLYLELPGGDMWGSIKNNTNLLAKITQVEDVAEKEIRALEEDIAELNEQVEKTSPATLVTLVSEGQLSAYGKGSRFGIVHETFGFPEADQEIEVSTHGQSVSYEYVLEKNPAVLFVIDRTKAIGGDDENNDVARNELVQETTASKHQKIISLTPDVWYLAGGGLESTHLMIEDVKKGLAE